MIKLGYAYIVLAAVIFSTMEITAKLAVGLNPIQLNFLRFVIGGIILIPPTVKALKMKGVKLGKKDLYYFLCTGFLCVVVSMSFFQLAITYTKASIVAIIFSTNPVFTVVLAYFILKEKLNRGTVISIVLSLIGIACILDPFASSSGIIGIVLSIMAAITFSLYSVVGKMRSGRYGSTALNCITFLVGSFIMLVIILITKLSAIRSMINPEGNYSFMSNIPVFAGINHQNIFPLIFLGVVVTGLGYLFYFLAMDETSATMASVVFFIKPALAPILALIILGEKIPINTMVGILFILIGSYFSLTAKGKAYKENVEKA
ncbi:DMT family transporter [Clostridium sp.]|jgi:drug/metabolite transporter (DMT)-like permease|uniref:DMT family transporter n=1 Tax=Clostridium sp. TaxID=1506 RepID=UPI003A5C50E7